jgi:hypothetical protein
MKYVELPGLTQYCSLRVLNRWLGCVVGAGPVVMVGAFDVPFGVFAFDDAGVGPWSAGGQEAGDEFGDGVGQSAGQCPGVAEFVLRGEMRPAG